MIRIKNKHLENKVLIIRSVIIAGIISLISLFTSEPLSFILGVVFGLIFSLLNFRLLDLTLKRSVNMPPEKAQKYVATRYFTRYLLTGIVVYVSITNTSINVLGTIVGLIILKLVIQVSNALYKEQSDRN